MNAIANTLFACFEGFRKKPAVVQAPRPRRVPGPPLLPDPNRVIVNGLELDYNPEDWPIEHALCEIMLHLNVKDIETLYIPTTRLEKWHGVAPRVFVPFQGGTYTAQYVDGELQFRPFNETRKIEYQLRGNLVMKPLRAP